MEESGTTDSVDVQVATLGKALGCAGAYVTGGRRLIEFLRNRARSFIFRRPFRPSRREWRSRRSPSSTGSRSEGTALGKPAEDGGGPEETEEPGAGAFAGRSAIFPLVVGGNERAARLAGRLYEEGVLVPAIRPPTVPEGTARLRLTVTAAHSGEDIDRVLNVLGRSLAGAA